MDVKQVLNNFMKNIGLLLKLVNYWHLIGILMGFSKSNISYKQMHNLPEFI